MDTSDTNRVTDAALNRAPYRTGSNRLRQTQEPMTIGQAVGDAVQDHLGPDGLGKAFDAIKQVERIQVAQAFMDLLDTYDNGEGECEPEDRWRLFRDAYALAERYGATRPAESKVQPPYEPTSTSPAA